MIWNLKLMQEQQQFDEQSSISAFHRQEQIKQELRLRVQEILQTTQKLPVSDCLQEVRQRLLNIQEYCRLLGKTFIFVEKEIFCNQYDLQGDVHDAATLFHGPKEDASVAICVTRRGSLLYRNHCPWMVYRDMGDIGLLYEDATNKGLSPLPDTNSAGS